jgi:hypothetical protein
MQELIALSIMTGHYRTFRDTYNISGEISDVGAAWPQAMRSARDLGFLAFTLRGEGK